MTKTAPEVFDVSHLMLTLQPLPHVGIVQEEYRGGLKLMEPEGGGGGYAQVPLVEFHKVPKAHKGLNDPESNSAPLL